MYKYVYQNDEEGKMSLIEKVESRITKSQIML